MAIPLIIGAAIVAGAGVAKAIQGAQQARRARQIEQQNIRPEFDIASEYFENRDLAAQQAQSGLGAPALDFYTRGAERGLTASLAALTNSGGGPNAVANLYDVYQQGVGGIAAADAQAQAANIRNLMAQNEALAAQRTMQWSLNRYEPFKDQAQLASQLRQTGTQNIYSGISQVGSAVGSFGKGMEFSSLGGGAGGGSSRMADEEITTLRPNATFEPVEQINVRSAMQGMQGSPYQDLIEQRLRRNYAAYNPSYFNR